MIGKCCILMWFTFALTGGAQTVLSTTSSAVALSHTILVPGPDFTKLSALCNQFLKDERRVVTQWIFVTNERQQDNLVKSIIPQFDRWLDGYHKNTAAHIQVAEMIAIRDNVVVKIRDGPRVTRLVLEGRDPLFVNIGDSTFEILHVAHTSGLFGLQIFVRAENNPSQSASKQLYEHLVGVLKSSSLYVVIRPDYHFLTEAYFPMYYSYYIGKPPSLQEYRSAPYALCGALTKGEPGCITFGMK